MEPEKGILSTRGITESATAGPLTLDVLLEAFRAVEEQQYRPHHHTLTVKGKDAVRAGGRARCVECGGVIELRDGRVVVVGF